jgi:hypothetical protein
MTRLNITIDADVPDDQRSRARILLSCDVQIEALIAKLTEESGKPVSHKVRFITARDPKAAPDPGTQIAQGAALGDDPVSVISAQIAAEIAGQSVVIGTGTPSDPYRTHPKRHGDKEAAD